MDNNNNFNNGFDDNRQLPSDNAKGSTGWAIFAIAIVLIVLGLAIWGIVALIGIIF